jgi:dissimilatory sulfite reductase (desulfoviridin) alpha/beta subunit
MEVDYNALKQGGFMRQSQKDNFSLRLKIVAGTVTAEQLPKLAEVAEKYGKGYVHLTTRQGVEIPFIKLEDIDAVKAELAKVNLHPGVCGPRVRTVIACQGNILCPHGLINAEDIGKKTDERYYGKVLPHKFKFAITACINSCAKPQENDFGAMGVVLPTWEGNDVCSSCELCVEHCPKNSVWIDAEGVHFDFNKCSMCGDCIKICPLDCWKAKKIGYTVFVGGKIGRHPELGFELAKCVDEDELFRLMDASINFYIEHGQPGERFGDTLHRVGQDKFRQEVGAPAV